MPVIKRYSNRKLYDTEAKQYITLDGIAEIIRGGEDVQVIDNTTGEDLTAVTLTQIIFEQEKKQSGFLPRTLLSSLIQTGGDRFNSLQRTLASSVNIWRQIDEEIKSRIQTLVSQGDLTEGEGQHLLSKLIAQGIHPKETSPISSKELESYLAKHQIPTQADVQQLMNQIEALSAKLEEISNSQGSSS